MSYDLTILPKDDGQSWDDALAAAEGSESAGTPDAEVWERIVAGAQHVLGDVSIHRGEDYYELTHEATGIQLGYSANQVGITVPYWYSGAEADSIVTTIYRLGYAIEAATGFKGYDPQLDLSLSEASLSTSPAVATFEHVKAMFKEQGF
jgi:hypothetical protein